MSLEDETWSEQGEKSPVFKPGFFEGFHPLNKCLLFALLITLVGKKRKKKENIGKKPTTFKILSAFVVSLSVSLNSVNFAKI